MFSKAPDGNTTSIYTYPGKTVRNAEMMPCEMKLLSWGITGPVNEMIHEGLQEFQRKEIRLHRTSDLLVTRLRSTPDGFTSLLLLRSDCHAWDVTQRWVMHRWCEPQTCKSHTVWKRFIQSSFKYHRDQKTWRCSSQLHLLSHTFI